MPRVVVLQHSPGCVPGRLGNALIRAGLVLDVRRVYAEGADAIPAGLHDVRAVLTLGGPMGVNDGLDWIAAETRFLRRAHEAGLPLVGICLGHQLIAKALGGAVAVMPGGPEVGFVEVALTPQGREDPVLAGVPWKSLMYSSHGDEVTETPPGAVVLSGSERCRVQAFRVGQTTYGFQHHFEWTRALALRQAEADPGFVERGGLTIERLGAQFDEHDRRFGEISERRCELLALMVF